MKSSPREPKCEAFFGGEDKRSQKQPKCDQHFVNRSARASSLGTVCGSGIFYLRERLQNYATQIAEKGPISSWFRPGSLYCQHLPGVSTCPRYYEGVSDHLNSVQKQIVNLKEASKIFAEVATLLELKNENQFKIRAFQSGSRTLETYPGTFEEFVSDVQEKKIKGFGPQLGEAILELHETEALVLHEELLAGFPDTLLDLLAIPGLGAKKLKALYTELQISSLSDLEAACYNGSVAALKGFGEKTAANLLEGIEKQREYQNQFRLDVALPQANQLLEFLRNLPGCAQAEIAGSLRRGSGTVKDIDLIAASSSPLELAKLFCGFEDIQKVISSGETKTSLLLKSGIQADLRIVQTQSFGSALVHFTGSKEHNTALRTRAKEFGAKLNEYGLSADSVFEPIANEEDVYNRLNLAFIYPELRENLGEVETAATLFSEGKHFPDLVTNADIRGVIHVHTRYSDGTESLEEMAEFVRSSGFEYIGISDHSRSAAYAGGLSIDEVKRQHDEIDALNERMSPFLILKGIESDILADGSLDYPDSVLETFDFVIASLHSQLRMPEKEMMARLKNAAANPYTTIIGHPSTRILLKRDAAEVNISQLLEYSAEHGVAVEINASPRRLDLDWRYHRRAVEFGVPLPICPDAHSIDGINDIRYGVLCARKGGLTVEQVPNTQSRDNFLEFLMSKK